MIPIIVGAAILFLLCAAMFGVAWYGLGFWGAVFVWGGSLLLTALGVVAVFLLVVGLEAKGVI